MPPKMVACVPDMYIVDMIIIIAVLAESPTEKQWQRVMRSRVWSALSLSPLSARGTLFGPPVRLLSRCVES
jgi:hypothetical protein